MTTFRTTIATFLDDLIYAQHQANKLSARLSRQYRENTTLRFFPVPNALLDEVDITLRFSVDPLDTAGESPVRPAEGGGTLPPPRIIAADVAHEIATLVLAELRRRTTPGDEGGTKTIAATLRRQLWMPAIRHDLTRNLAAFLHPVLTRYALAPPEAGRDDETRLAIGDALEATFGDDADLASVVGPADEWARQLAQGDIGTHASVAVRAAAARGSTMEPEEPSASAHIQLAAHHGGATDDNMQTVRLHARLRNYTWVIVEEGNQDLYQLVPES